MTRDDCDRSREVLTVMSFSSVSFKDNKARSFKWKGVEGGGQMEVQHNIPTLSQNFPILTK